MKLNYKKTFYIGLAFFLISMFWQTYDSIISKILIDKFGLNQTASGFFMALDNILALFLIPLFGHLSDKRNASKGRRTYYVIVGTIISAFAFMSLSFTDNFQTKEITDNYPQVAQEYEWVQEGDHDLSDWTMMQSEIETTWTGLLNDGKITQAKYDSINSDIILKMDALISDNDISSQDTTKLNDYVYSHLHSLAALERVEAPLPFILFILILLVALVAMSTFRSPAVALMPDITIKPLRSKANAIINLTGTLGGIIAIVVIKIFALDNGFVTYQSAFFTVGILMLVLLGLFIWKVKEVKWVKEREQLDIKLGLTEEDEIKDENINYEELSKEKRKSLILILVSVFLWFMGYNALTSKLSIYANQVLSMGFANPLLIAQGAALISFIPIGILATKIGRKKTVIMGVILLSLCFAAIYVFGVINFAPELLMNAFFAFTGVSWATINVNSYPMVAELSKGSNVGKYTGYYYTFSMAAQILTPMLSGLIMDSDLGLTILPLYSAIFVALALITMLNVKHGDSKAIKKDSLIENFDVDMD